MTSSMIADSLSSLPSSVDDMIATASIADEKAASDAIFKQKTKGIPCGRLRRERIDVSSERSTLAKTVVIDAEELELDNLLAELRVDLDVKKGEEERLEKQIAELLLTTTSGRLSGNSMDKKNTVSISTVDESRAFNLAATRLNNSLLLVEGDSQQLAASLKAISKLADSISSKVSELDVAKTRVVECLQLVADMRDLRVCSEGVEDAIRAEEWNAAAELVNRFLTLDKAVFQLRDANDERDAGTSVRSSYEIMERATLRLKEEFRRRMEEAVEKGDKGVPEMQRFIKLFPLIHEYETGISLFAVYLTKQISKIGQDNIKIMNAGGTDESRAAVLYADTLFLFLSGLADLLDVHHAIIESSYGPDRLLDLVTQLQPSVDKVVESVVEAFKNRRHLDEVMREVARAEKERARGRDSDKDKHESGVDALSLDVLLNEITQIGARTELYWRFLRKKILSKEHSQPRIDEEERGEDANAVEERRVIEVERAKKRETTLHKLFHDSGVGKCIQNLLSSYINLEKYYIEEMIMKAIGMDAREEKGQSWPTSSLVDDTMFIIRKAARRAIFSASADTAAALINNSVEILEEVFCMAIQHVLKGGYPSSSLFTTDMLATVGSVVPAGAGTSSAKLAEQREDFVCMLNNARVASEMTRQLKNSLLHEAEQGDAHRSDVERGKLSAAISQLEDVAKNLEHLAAKAIASVENVTIKPSVKSSCDSYSETSHCLTESQLAEAESVDPFIESFCASIHRLLTPFEKQMAPENYQELVLLSCGTISSQLEKAILSSSFNRLGALQLDRELRHLTGFLSEMAGFVAREKCTRLSQIVCVLNVDCVEEAKEVWESGGGSVRALSLDFLKKILLRRVDLAKKQVQQMEV